ncbi:unnamed protein product [Arabidopsis thaliana]|uniref:Uncharacterized protein n=1 Tax=Arabidopsis thaliana TaxID=3702 RepID=A0A5S9YB85_ARATH|nr:unnamed protein product [Arabidopsis thaliana]
MKEKEHSVLLYAIHLHLMWKKYLIVCYNIRENDNWDEMLDVKLNEDEKWGKYLSDGFAKWSTRPWKRHWQKNQDCLKGKTENHQTTNVPFVVKKSLVV